MGFNNPSMPWWELERRLSDRPSSRKRQPYQPPPLPELPERQRRRGSVPYAELHCHSNFSFLDGASHPEELVEEAVRLGLEALAITDHDGMYGVVRFAEAARTVGLPTIFGAELTLDLPHRSQAGNPDPEGRHLVVLARDPAGYASLCRVISRAHLDGGEKGLPRVGLSQLAQSAAGHWLVLTGCRKGTVPAALAADGPTAAARQLADLAVAFGTRNVAVELWDHGDPLDSARNDALVALAARAGIDVVATNNVHYDTPARRPLATALAAVRARRSLDELDGWLPAGAGAHLRSGVEQARRFARYPGVVDRAAAPPRGGGGAGPARSAPAPGAADRGAGIGGGCASDRALAAPTLPPSPCPPGHDEMSWLRQLTEQGAIHRYGRRPAVPGGPE